MIKSFKHKGLEKLFVADDHRGVSPVLRSKLKRILFAMSAATTVQELNLPGLKLHALKGDLQGHWAVSVSGNWRVVFRFDGDAHELDLVDYH